MSFVNIPDETFQTSFAYFILVNIAYAFSSTMGHNIFQIVANMDLTIADINKFKYIFENQNEAVIILSNGNTIDYVNSKFLYEFKNEIMKIYETKFVDMESIEIDRSSYGSRTRKITKFLKSVKAMFHNKTETDDEMIEESEFLHSDLFFKSKVDN